MVNKMGFVPFAQISCGADAQIIVNKMGVVQIAQHSKETNAKFMVDKMGFVLSYKIPAENACTVVPDLHLCESMTFRCKNISPELSPRLGYLLTPAV